VCANVIKDIKAAGTYKVERVISSAQSTLITAQGKQVINFCANNYLGFCNNARIVKAAQNVMNHHGYGMSSVRFICGT
jgi:glycine C-acetyltransferase